MSVVTSNNCNTSFVAALPGSVPVGYVHHRHRDGQRQQYLRILRLCPGGFGADTEGCAGHQSSGNAGLDEYADRLCAETDQQSLASDPMDRRDEYPVVINGQFVVTLPTGTGNRFYVLSFRIV